MDEQPELAAQFGVMSIPMLAVMKNGEVVNQAVGARPKAQILEMLPILAESEITKERWSYK